LAGWDGDGQNPGEPPESSMLDLQIAPRPESHLPHAGTYVREMAVSVERMYENTLDWAHLPHLHGSSFSRIELIAQEELAWRARVWSPGARDDASIVIELRLDPECRRWITRTVEGRNAGGEVWTHCIPLSDDPARPRLQVVVDFFVPGLTAAMREPASRGFLSLYKRLYDEDERMMLERQAALDRRVLARQSQRQRGSAGIDLGPVAAVRARAPFDVEAGQRRFRVLLLDGALHAHALDCPHWLAPLDAVAHVGGVLTCPWHGYRFDLRDGARLPGGSGDVDCRLAARLLHADARGHVVLDA
jgi:nitrite reductase/ring-hydroxylating ferredoxin subunit